MLSVPIRNMDGDVIGVAQAVNKTEGQNKPFDDHDEKVFTSYVAFCGIALCNAERQERAQLEQRRNQLLLDLARVIFEEQNSLPQLIHKLMRHTQEALRCEQCHVLLLDEVSHVSDHHCAATKCHTGIDRCRDDDGQRLCYVRSLSRWSPVVHLRGDVWCGQVVV
ncbi:hypothetical protein NP493_370g05015 [Ridgeia piscesae]|uniref:GAF domain-containing protein n=1 Tax=Ridgeia piscesae TaxID=27915 RepID=A0AAD9L339_RIDPI|nr:hypothetical protein NP493_370g05015 [Ridgeia piscesae]